jgi:hypothetical protein
MRVIETTLDVISPDQIVKAIPSRNEDTDVEIFSMVPRFGISLRTKVARTEDSECSGTLTPPIRKTKTKPQ